ncbi:YHS domain-containing (seleno)protein [Flavobacterium sp. AED]|uniref:YHS domain-containing (seleno)protein n=1 Tax=Flavobacterium sp. AED TaxID=1423323 RepID=UPI00068D5492|nr:YHS domain-containing (seleno)protein [Flavobacterium sp. AED]
MKSKNHKGQKNSFKLVSKKQILYLFVVFISLSTFAQTENSRLTHFNLERKVAIQGYDPVAYFKQGKAVKGKKELTATYEGVTYNFSMPVNKEYFLKNPLKYEPQFGGWCAYAMGDSGEKVEINPDTFKIIDEKLYLFYNAYFNNTLKSWNKDQANLKSKAESNWKKIIK